MTDLLIGAILLGLLPAAIAKTRGQDFFVWWVYGAFLFPLALIHAFFVRPGSTAVGRFITGSGSTTVEDRSGPGWRLSPVDPLLWLLAIGAGVGLASTWIWFISP